MTNLAYNNVIPDTISPYTYSIKGGDNLDDYKNKKLVNTYQKDNLTISVYKPVLTDDEREYRDIQIKSKVIEIAKG